MSERQPNSPGPDQVESREAVVVEFSADELTEFPPDSPVSEAVYSHLPSWLREDLLARGLVPARPGAAAALADCLLEQARVLVKLRRYAEAAPRVAEAERLYQDAGMPAGVADCYHVAAAVHDGLGEPDRAFDLLRREEDLRRRLAA